MSFVDLLLCELQHFQPLLSMPDVTKLSAAPALHRVGS